MPSRSSIPKNMGNDESKLVASIIVAERNFAIAEGKLKAANARYNRWKNEISIQR